MPASGSADSVHFRTSYGLYLPHDTVRCISVPAAVSVLSAPLFFPAALFRKEVSDLSPHFLPESGSSLVPRALR